MIIIRRRSVSRGTLTLGPAQFDALGILMKLKPNELPRKGTVTNDGHIRPTTFYGLALDGLARMSTKPAPNGEGTVQNFMATKRGREAHAAEAKRRAQERQTGPRIRRTG